MKNAARPSALPTMPHPARPKNHRRRGCNDRLSRNPANGRNAVHLEKTALLSEMGSAVFLIFLKARCLVVLCVDPFFA
jgi:hypothetical protein